MKKSIYIFYSLIVVLILAIGCSPDEPGPIGEPENRTQQLSGTWKITQAIQVDEKAKFKGFPAAVTFMDITNILPEHPYTDFAITFNANGSYTVDKGRALVDTPDNNGSWAFDYPAFPTAIILTGANGSVRQLDIIDIEGLRYDKPETRSINLGLVRYLGKGPILSYRYQMAYQNN